MAANIIDGKELAKQTRIRIKREARALTEARGIVPGLAVVLIGHDPASEVYVRNKESACRKVGFLSRVYRLQEDVPQAQVLELIGDLNADPQIHGILVQAPRPAHLDDDLIDNAVSPFKDVDGFNQVNAGRFFTGRDAMESCTPTGVIRMLKSEGIDIAGKHAVVLGRSNIVGKPMAMMLLRENATVTICHSRTKDLAQMTRSADILVAAIGRSNFVTADMVKPGAVVIDVGINRTEDGIAGDVDYEAVKEVASYITPVPGGVGPMTIAMLLENTLKSAQRDG